MDNPLVSINIVTRDRGNLLPKAIDSALSQIYSPFEIIIVDNESRDNTKEIIEEYIKQNPNIKYFFSSYSTITWREKLH